MGVGRQIVDEAKKETKDWGFDLLDFGSKKKAQAAWKAMGLPTKPKKTMGSKPYMRHIWSKPGLDVVCTNNPFEGEEKRERVGSMKGKAGYCSYVGIRGKAANVKKAAAAFKKGDYKGESPGALDFVNFEKD